MKVEEFDDKKLVCVWLSHQDQNDPSLQERLKPLYREYKEKKYLVSVFFSGHEDIEELTRDLIQYNRKKTEENSVAAEKKKKNNKN